MDYWLIVVLFLLFLDKSWSFLSSLVTSFNSSDHLKQLIDQKQKLQLEQQHISAQDQYSKWTKNNRKLESLEKQIQSAKDEYLTSMDVTKSRLRKLKLLGITLPSTFLKFYKSKLQIFTISKGIFPSLVEGILEHGWLYVVLGPLKWKSIGEGTMITVSLGTWMFAFLHVLSTLEFIFGALGETPPRLMEQMPSRSETEKASD